MRFRSSLHIFPSLLGFALVCSVATAKPNDPKTEHGFPGMKLPKKLTRGANIPVALGNRIAEVAQAYGHTEAELRALCYSDRSSLNVDDQGRLAYICGAIPPVTTQTATGSGGITAPSYPLSETFNLSSDPAATKTIYLDFTGHVTSNTVWNCSITNGEDIVTPAYDIDGDPTTFSDAELASIQDIWKRVCEDYAPFKVNVTTSEPPAGALMKDDDTDVKYGIRVVIGGNSSWFDPNSGGVAYLGSFTWHSDTPAFVFPAQLGNGNPKYVAEAAAHEAGHSFGLSHDGTSSVEYYQGAYSWAPIMGVAYYRAVSQWSKGEYSGANNKEDDVAIIASELGYRADAYGNASFTATELTGPNYYAEGIIETAADVDVFKINAGAGSLKFSVTPDNVSPNLDVQLRLINSAGSVVTTSNPTTLNAAIVSTVAQGTYYLEVSGVGTSKISTGYSDYASVGQYRISGTAVAPNNQPPVAVADNSGPLTGTASFTATFSSAGSADPDGTIKTYAWRFGDGTTGTGATATHTYTIPGTYTALLTVTDMTGLSGTDTVTVVVNPPPPVFVHHIDMTLAQTSGRWIATAAVTVVDQNGYAIPNATVTGTWSGLVRGTYSGKSDVAGVARIASPTTTSRGTFTFTVTGIIATGYKYDATKNGETKDSIITP